MVTIDSGSQLLLRALACAAYPREGCGILIGLHGDRRFIIRDVIYGRNRRTDRLEDRYDLHPDDILQAERDALAQDLEVVGFWHSHPDHPAEPSAFDSERAWTDYVYVICAITENGSGDLNAFEKTSENGVLEPISLVVPVPV